jgi:2-methylcitrate dehydratase PrpD
MKYYSEQIADYIYQLSYEDLPAKVVEHAKWVILDAIGVALASWDTPWSLAVYRSIRKMRKLQLISSNNAVKAGFDTSS